MRDIDAPMTEAEFDEALTVAKAGGAMFDNGATDEVLVALDAVANAAPRAPAALVEAAVKAYEHSR